MVYVLTWWVLLELIGIAVLPLAFRFFRHLPDRGYAFTKPLGLLLIAYPFWLLTTFGFLTNTRGAIVGVALVVAAASWWQARDHAAALGAWLRHNLSVVVVTELVFTVAFLAWAYVRAFMPEISATEKPMDFAFLNGILQSEKFPPLDPWLSGYAISYYYFGYLVTAVLTQLSGVPASYAFNLMIALLFALGATGAFGLAHNLIRQAQLAARPATAQLFALFAPIFLVLIGNLEGFFESVRALGIGAPEFWQWLDVKGLANAPATGSFAPTDNWWWWRASRVIHDVVNGQTQEVIDEFPQFSFVLGDLHPHVLALPFVLLALAVALNLLNSQFEIQDAKFTWRIRNFELRITHFEWLYPLVLGGLFVLNSWDILPYGFILVAAFAVARYRASGTWDRAAVRDTATFVGALGVASVVLYLPFYLGFQSQAGGILPVLFVKTRLHQYLIMLGLFVFLCGAFAARLLIERGIGVRAWFDRATLPLLAAFIFPLLAGLFAFIIVVASPAIQDQARVIFPNVGENIPLAALAAFFTPWLRDPWLFVLLAGLLATLVVVAREFFDAPATLFVLLLAFTAFLLTFGVEFVYLKDQFWTRMNTVFKFYFQVWTLLSVASAYAVFYLAHRLRGVVRAVWWSAFALLLFASLFYPAMAIPSRANDFRGAPTLDGIAFIREINPGDYGAIQWLNANAPRGAVTLEAPGAEYSYENRISMATGLPTVLGWAGHESQWRGNANFFKNDAEEIDRAADVQRIYQTLDAPELLTYLDKYAIKFVVVGQTEKTKYGLTRTQIDKFGKVMTLVLDNGDVRIYAR